MARLDTILSVVVSTDDKGVTALISTSYGNKLVDATTIRHETEQEGEECTHVKKSA